MTIQLVLYSADRDSGARISSVLHDPAYQGQRHWTKHQIIMQRHTKQNNILEEVSSAHDEPTLCRIIKHQINDASKSGFRQRRLMSMWLEKGYRII